MTIYYVDATTGNDSDSGLTEELAWQTIGKVNGSSFNAGDSILFKRGETWTGTTLVVPSSGSVGQPIVFTVYGAGNKPVIQNAAGAFSFNVPVGKHHILIQNLHISDGDWSLAIEGHDVTVEDCEVDLADDTNIWINGGQADVYNVTITRCLSHNAYHQGIHVNASPNAGPTAVVIEYCTSYSNGTSANLDHGIYIKHCSNITIRNNTSYSNYASGIKLGDACNTSLVECNICYSNGADGIVWISDTSDGTGNTIRNNLCYENTNNNIELADGAKNGYIYNNTLVNSVGRGFGVGIGGGNGATGHIIKNNLMFQNSAIHNNCALSVGAAAVQPPNNTFDYNLIYFQGSSYPVKVDGVNKTFGEWQAWAGSPDAHGLSANPSFVAAYTDLHLGYTSPAKDVGSDVGITYDLEGKIRPQGPAVDIGAYEFYPTGGSPADDRYRFRRSSLIGYTSTRLRRDNMTWPPDTGILDPSRDAVEDSRSRIL